jgi:hypothetical protein
MWGSTSDQDPAILRRAVAISGFRTTLMGIPAMPMTDPSVSDLVFRALEQDTPSSRGFDDAWEASLREELEKLRPARSAPRVVPAADTGARPSRFER